MSFRTTLLFVLSAGAMLAQSFTYNATMRAGGFAGRDWELGVGTNTAASNGDTEDFRYLGVPGQNHWGGPTIDHAFRIGWAAATNTAYVTVWNANNDPFTASFNNTGAQISTNAIWTLPAGTLFASAANTNTSISLNNLAFSPGVTVQSGSLPSSILVDQPSNFFSTSNPIVINPASAGGNWYISGTVRFTGLDSQGGVARNSGLQFMMRATGTNVPEAGTMSLLGAGLVALAMMGRRNRKGNDRA